MTKPTHVAAPAGVAADLPMAKHDAVGGAPETTTAPPRLPPPEQTKQDVLAVAQSGLRRDAGLAPHVIDHLSPDALLATALLCIRHGLSVVPIDHKTKRPAMGLLPRDSQGRPTWGPYQKLIVDEETVRRWIAAGIRAIGIVGGGVSGGLLILDFDDPRFYTAWRDLVGALADGLPVQQTGGGGYHVFLRCSDPGGNDKLAWAPDAAAETGRTTAIETRGEGGYAVVAPSIHPSGNRYKMLHGDLSQIPLLAQAHADALVNTARKLDRAPRTRQEQDRLESQALTAHTRTARRNGQAGVIGAFNAKHDVEDLLQRYGYTKGSHGRYIRPGGASESVSARDGRSIHWSTNDPLNDGKVVSGCGVHDAFDLYTHFEHGGDVHAGVKATATMLGMSSAGASKAAGVIEAYRPFPVHILPEPLQEFVLLGARAIGCDPAFLALPLLAALASAIGNSRALGLKMGWAEHAILWAVLIAESGRGKSPAIEQALRAVRKRQRAAMKRYEAAMRQYTIDLLHYEKDLSAWKRKASGEPPVEPPEPTAERCWCDDSTVEALAVLLQQNPRGLIMIRDELSGWLGSFDRYAQGRGGDVAKWLEMFGGRPMVVDRKGGNPRTLYVPRAAVSIAGGIQPGALRRALGEQYRENGLAARLLLACPPYTPKRWREDGIAPEVEARTEAVFDGLYVLQPRTGEGGDPEPVILTLTSDGKAAWTRFYNRHAEEQAELTGDLAAAWAKLEAYAARLALIVHLVRCASSDTTADPTAVDAASIQAGVTLARWFGNEARRVYALLAESDADRARRQLVELVERKGGRVALRDLARGSRLYPDAAAWEAALQDLIDAGLGHWEYPPAGPQGGHPAKLFCLTAQPPAAQIDDVLAVDTTPRGDVAA